jgi:hypothetical protein
MEILTSIGFKKFDTVIDKGIPEFLIKLTFDDQSYIKATPDHRFLIDEEWLETEYIEIGFQLCGKSVICVEYIEPETVYDVLNVDEVQSFMASGVNAHNCLFLDEFAHISNNIADAFFASVYPTISSGKTSKLAVISTPNGMNHFYKLWKEAEDGTNEFTPVFADWKSIPSRDQAWADKMKATLGPIKFAQEMEGSFIGASNTLISGSKIKCIPTIKPIFSNSTTSVFAKPIKNNKYVLLADTSRGTGGDYSAFLIIDVTVLPYSVVFKYRNNTISSMLYPSVINKMALEYNTATCYIESNDIGEGVANALYYDLEYEDTIFSTGGEIVTWGGKNSTAGVRTTSKTKRIGCDILKQLIEMDKVIINDVEILLEMSNFVVKGPSYAADTGHDDLMMCLIMFAYLTTTVKFEEITDVSVKQRIIAERQLQEEHDMIPIGYYNDGEEGSLDGFTF